MITLAQDPTSQLIAPASEAGDYMAQTRMNCGLVAGGVDSFINFITGFSPLEEWVFKPLTGDWRAMAAGADAWANAGKSIEVIASDINTIVMQVDERWSGETFNNFANHQTVLAEKLSDLPPACAQMSEMTAALLEAAKGIADLIATAIDIVVSLAVQLMAEAAIPVVGEIGMAASISAFAVRVARWSAKLSKAIATFGRLVSRISPIVNRMMTGIQKVASILNKLHGFKKEEATATATTEAVEGGGAFIDAWNKTGEPIDMSNLMSPEDTTAGGGW
jgi:uncharacterized protein YukE